MQIHICIPFSEIVRSALLIARLGSLVRAVLSDTTFANERKILIKAAKCLKKGVIMGNYVILSTNCSSARASNSPSSSRFTRLHHLLTKRINCCKHKRLSVAYLSNLIAYQFNSQTIDYQLCIILEYIVYQFDCSLGMTLIDLCARQIDRVGHVGLVSAHSRAIARVSLTGRTAYTWKSESEYP